MSSEQLDNQNTIVAEQIDVPIAECHAEDSSMKKGEEAPVQSDDCLCKLLVETKARERPVPYPVPSTVSINNADGVPLSVSFYNAMKELGIDGDPEAMLKVPEDPEAQIAHLDKLRRTIEHFFTAIREHVKIIEKMGLPLHCPGEPDHLKAALHDLDKQLRAIKQHTVYHCLRKGTDTSTGSDQGTFFFHLLLRQPELVKDWMWSLSLLNSALGKYRLEEKVSDDIFARTKIINDTADWIRGIMRNIVLEHEQQILSFCAYLLGYGESSGIKVIPETSLGIRFALQQARDVCPAIRTKDFYRMVEGYIEQGIERKRHGECVVVVNVVQLLEEEVVSRDSGEGKFMDGGV